MFDCSLYLIFKRAKLIFSTKLLIFILFSLTDKIDIQVENDSSAILKYINDHKSFICNETQSIGLKFVDNLNNSKTMEIKINHSNINSETVNYYITKI